MRLLPPIFLQIPEVHSILAGLGALILLLVIGFAFKIFQNRAKLEEKQKIRKQLISSAETTQAKDLVLSAKEFLKDEENLLKDLPLLEAVLKCLVAGGALQEASQLMPKAIKLFPNRADFTDLELDLLAAKKSADSGIFDKLWLGFQKKPEKKEWLARCSSIAINSGMTTPTALKALGEHFRQTGDPKTLNYLSEVYDKKKIYTETSQPFFEKMLEKEPRKLKWNYAVSRCRQNLGDLEGAEKFAKKCLDLDGSFQPALDILAMLKKPSLEDEAPVPSSGETTSENDINSNCLPQRYTEVTELGRGGMGVVFKSFDDGLKRWVAIKVLLESDAPNQEELRERFLSESRIMAKLDHPVIPKVFDVSVKPPCYIALEFIEGTDFRTFLNTHPNLPFPEIFRIARDLADGFHHAYERGVFHRDIKPENLMIENTGKIRILDFGLAKFHKQDTHLTQAGLVVGTPWYMAPERLKGEPTNLASEIFSFGVTLYEISVGKRPFEGDDFSVIFFQDPKPIREIRKECPLAFEILVLDCLNKNPANRPASFAEIRAELEKLSSK